MHRKILLRTISLSIMTLGLCSCLAQDENIQSSAQAAERQEMTSVKNGQKNQLQQGLTAYVDSETNKLRAPTKEERQQLRFQEQQLQATTTGSNALEEKVLPDGTVMVDLKGQLQHRISVDVLHNCEKNNKNNACSQKADNR